MSPAPSRALASLLLAAPRTAAMMNLSARAPRTATLGLGVARPPGLLLLASSSRRARFAAAASSTTSNDNGTSPPPQPPTQQNQQQERFVVTARELLRDYRGAQRVRVDQYLADRWPAARALAAGASASRARVQQALKAGLVTVNGAACTKPSSGLRAGDVVVASLPPPEPLARAEPEAGLDLRVVWEDAHCAVVFKPAGMVVHPSPGHSRGTLVNALLHHLGLPAMEAGELMTGNPSRKEEEGGGEGDEDDDDGDPFSEEEEDEDQDLQRAPPPPLNSTSQPSIVRPGIVHRLDRGTTGLMVVAKTDAAHARLCAQFKARTVGRVYASVVAPLQSQPGGSSLLPATGRVATNVARDPRDRLRMAAAPLGSARGRPAASNFRVLGTARDLVSAEKAVQVAGRVGGWGGDGPAAAATGGAGGTGGTTTIATTTPPLVVEWRLETGRTHQIRVHARHLGWPLVGDDTYGPGNASAAGTIVAAVDAERKKRRGGGGGARGESGGGNNTTATTTERVAAVKQALDAFGRPALHARYLAFDHPVTGERLSFDCGLPEDMVGLLRGLGGTLSGGGGDGG